MWRRFRPPLLAVAIVLFGLMAVLAWLQYRWLGQISEAERDRLRAGMTTGASEFASDFDREIARAFLLFQPDGPEALNPSDAAQTDDRFAARYDRWQASARYPRLIKDFYLVSLDSSAPNATMRLRRFEASGRTLNPAEWPESMGDWRERLLASEIKDATTGNSVFIRRMPPAIWDTVPAIVVPTPIMFTSNAGSALKMTPALSFALLTIDLNYVSKELLPSLAERHFSSAGQSAGYKAAVVSRDQQGKIIFQSTPEFSPALDATGDATADLFQLRPQDFAALNAEVRRFTTFAAPRPEEMTPPLNHRLAIAETRPLSIVVQTREGAGAGIRGDVPPGSQRTVLSGTVSATRLNSSPPSAHWKLVVAHPLGSLDAAVRSQRRRNLAVSGGVMGLLGVSMGMLVLSTRRAQRLAKQQMEFVAAVSHELRTPLAVIRSAAENLADGVVHDDQRIRRYGELMSAEGRRLTEMVEQILELAGIQSGQRGFALTSVSVAPLLRDIVSASSPLIERAGVQVEFEIADDVPSILGDEPALRRVFQNLIDNAVKYGSAGGWIRIGAKQVGADVAVSVADNGIGIEPADQARIFEPFYRSSSVVAAERGWGPAGIEKIQGAGLGLSLVQRIVLAHGGRVTVKSTPREGSEFTVHLPAAGDRPAAVRVATGDAPHGAEPAPTS
jgi:signal transduction histidine kinase